MNILALDTCFGACSVAAGRRGEGVVCELELRQTGHAEALMPMIERVMAGAQLAFHDLDRIAVTTGPGSFTGMRIGVAAARALALATGAHVVGLGTLAVMAATARHQIALSGLSVPASAPMLVAVDARKGQVYAHLFGAAHDAVTPVALLSPPDAARLLSGGGVVLVGSGAHLVAADLVAAQLDAAQTDVHILFPDLQPNAACLAAMACTPDPFDLQPVRPLYLRPPDAKPQVGKSIPRLS